MTKIFIAGDKHGFKAIQYVKEWLKFQKIEFVDLGVKNGIEKMTLEKMIPPVVRGGVGK